MAVQIVRDEDSSTWDRADSLKRETARDRLDRKLAQAEALAGILVDGEGEAFESFNTSIKANVHWLLADLITECRIAASECASSNR